MVSHVFRESNYCVGKFTNIGFNFQTFTLWDSIPREVREDFNKEFLSLFILGFASLGIVLLIVIFKIIVFFLNRTLRQ
jgi:hypothetical protein